MPSKRSMLVMALSLAVGTGAKAEDLVTIYQQAVDYDSEIAASRATFNSQEERVNEARAGLLPNLSAGANLDRNRFDSDKLGKDTYNDFGYNLTLTQPLFRAQTWYQYEGSKFASKQAEANFAQAQQDLILRTAESYFEVLRAKENLTTTQAAEEAFKRAWEQAKERFDVGLIAVTEVHESKARYDNAQVTRIAAEGDLAVAQESLERLTGQRYGSLNLLAKDFPVMPPTPNDPDAWVQTAMDQNWTIKASEYAVETSQEQLKTNRAGHYPTLDALARYGYDDSKGPLSQADRNDVLTLGLELNVPLYSGGGTQASVRRARYDVERTEQELATVRRNTTLNTRSLFRNINTNIQSIGARQQAILSNESALEATRAGYEVGTRNIVEVLDAERNYYQALFDYANARFDYVLNSLRIKQAAGTLSPDDLIQLNRWLQAG